MSISFISDLHLSSNSKKTSILFIKYLKENHTTLEKLYILGDFFNYWVGDDMHLDSFTDVINALYEFNKPVSRTYIMYGNRDFLFGKNFFDKTNSELIPDPYFMTLDNKKIMLTHGDLLFDKTLSYQVFRRTCLLLNKSEFIRNAFFKFSIKFRENIAKKLRSYSKNTNYNRIVNFDDNSFIKNLKKHNVDVLIHGHTHIPCIQLLPSEDTFITRYTLSDWHDYINCLEYSEKYQFKLFYLK